MLSDPLCQVLYFSMRTLGWSITASSAAQILTLATMEGLNPQRRQECRIGHTWIIVIQFNLIAILWVFEVNISCIVDSA